MESNVSGKNAAPPFRQKLKSFLVKLAWAVAASALLNLLIWVIFYSAMLEFGRHAYGPAFGKIFLGIILAYPLGFFVLIRSLGKLRKLSLAGVAAHVVIAGYFFFPIWRSTDAAFFKGYAERVSGLDFAQLSQWAASQQHKMSADEDRIDIKRDDVPKMLRGIDENNIECPFVRIENLGDGKFLTLVIWNANIDHLYGIAFSQNTNDLPDHLMFDVRSVARGVWVGLM
jgi:hypothetical protein